MHQRRYHILVADQNEVSLNRVVKLLQRRDYVVAGASTLDEAEWWLAGWPLDLVIVPPRFGPETGVQLILRVRANQPDVMGLISTASGSVPDLADAGRHGLHSVSSVGPNQFLTRVAECLSTLTRRQRWPRKEITASVPMRIGEWQGKLMDVSYGGLKFELTEEHDALRSPVEIDFPRADLTLLADVVWSARRANGSASVFGAAVKPDPAPVAEWRAFVDRLA
jgi:DNA-binding response OmpR family regulator